MKFHRSLLSLLFLQLGLLPIETGGSNDLEKELLKNEVPAEVSLNSRRMKRTTAGYEPPRFFQPFYIFDESSFINGAQIVPTVCIRGGLDHDHNGFSLQVASGPEDNCFGQPCPPATVGVDFLDIDPELKRFYLRTRQLRCVNLTIVDDTEVEGLEFFLLILEDIKWGEIVDIASITIRDDDSPTFAAGQVLSFPEDAGTVPVCVIGGNITMTVILQSIANNSNATVGEDFEQVFSEFMLNPGEGICVDVVILDDSLYEGRCEVISLLFRSADDTNGTFSFQRTLVIDDNDATPRFESALYTVMEGDGQVEVCIQFDADPAITVDSTITTTEDSAKENTDYIHLDETVTIRGGTSVCRSIAIIANSQPQTYRTFTVSLTSSNSAVSEPFITTVAILDDDVLEFEDDQYIVNEVDEFVSVCVRLISDSNIEVRGTIMTMEGSAKDHHDFIPIRPTGFIVRSGRRCFSITIFKDKIQEPNEVFYVMVLTVDRSGRNLLDRRFTRVIIQDESALGLNCSVLLPPVNGNLMLTNANNIGSIASYRCDLGFILSGLVDNRRTCSLDGTWTGNNPTCEVLQCPQLSNPQDGSVSLPDRDANSVAVYTCNNGFRLEGDMERICDSQTGEWTGNEPFCVFVVCPALINPANGMVTVGLRTLNSEAMYTCSAGFVLNGAATRTCMISGEWSDTEPQCRMLGEPLEVELVNNSPRVGERTVSVEFEIKGEADNVVCKLDNKVIEEDFQSRSSGSMTFTDVEPGVHNLEITASNQDETVAVGRVFELSSNPDFCGLHLINKGLTVDGDSIRVEFAGRPAARAYRCKLDNDPGFDCNEPVVEMEGIKPGTHRLKIMHNQAECGPRRKLFVHFTV